MKIIHCADLHLDSKMERNLDKEKAKERKGELLHTFTHMVEYAKEYGVEIILIAGDLFDTKNISATARNTVLHVIIEHPGIRFYYLRGNHDADNFIADMEEIPENLKLFSQDWTTYEEADGKLTITGVELSKENAGSVYHSLVLDTNCYNIVMMHGQESEAAAKDKTEIVHLKSLRNKGIDYLALGHVHAYKNETLDARATYCYPGCLEGRGFDECGEHGFVLLDYNEETNQCMSQFVPFAKRRLYEIPVDVTGCETTTEMIEKAKEVLARSECEASDMVKMVLTGMVDVECEKDMVYFLTGFKEGYYFAKVYDETSLKINIEDYLLDESLKGEFVRQVMQDDALEEEDKKIVIRYGLQVLAGEEVQ